MDVVVRSKLLALRVEPLTPTSLITSSMSVALVRLNKSGQQAPTPPSLGTFPQGRVLYDSTIP